MADETIVDSKCTNERRETELAMFVSLHLNKTKYFGRDVIKSEIWREKKSSKQDGRKGSGQR